MPLQAEDANTEAELPNAIGEVSHESSAAPQRHTRFGRRPFLAGLTAFLAPSADAAATLAPRQWEIFKHRFLSPEGRIVDTGNGGISHSEGQGWGLLFALAARDEPAFSLIHQWTSRNLARPGDALHAWRFVPTDNPPVRDRNNATDGDIFIAAALAGAGRLWGQPDRLQASAGIARDILRLLVRRAGPYSVLLPGIDGFEAQGAVTVNLSYYAFPFIKELAALVPSPQWHTLVEDGQKLIDRGRFGSWELPPDWLRIASSSGALAPAPNWPPRFSFDAVRVPLWNAWVGLPNRSAMQAIDRFWSTYPGQEAPAWIDLITNQTAPYRTTAGMRAISAFLRSALNEAPLETGPAVTAASDYFDGALILLSDIGRHETTPLSR